MTDEYPPFRTVLRGYDPTQVEEMLDDVFGALDDAIKEGDDAKADLVRLRTEHESAVTAWQRDLEQMQARKNSPERSAGAAPATFENLGTRIGFMLSAADEEASEIRRNAHGEAQRVRDEAQAAALATRTEADHDVECLRAAAEEDAAAMIHQAQRAAAAVRTDAERDASDLRQQSDALYAEAEASTKERRTRLDRSVAEQREQADAEHAALLADHEAQLRDARARVAAVDAQAAERLTQHGRQREQLRATVRDVRAQIAGLIATAARSRDVSDAVADAPLKRPAAPPAEPAASQPRAAEPPDTEPSDTEPSDAGPNQADPNEADPYEDGPPARYAFGVVPETPRQPDEAKTQDGADTGFEGESWSQGAEEQTRRRWSLSSRR